MGSAHGKLSLAISDNDSLKVEKLLHKKPSIVNTPLNKTGTSALIKAVSLNRAGIVSLLLESPHIEVNKQTKSGETALIKAAKFGHFDLVKKLIGAGSKVDLEDRLGRNCLDFAMLYGRFQECRFLMARGMRLKPEQFYRKFELDFSGKKVNFFKMRVLLTSGIKMDAGAVEQEIFVPSSHSSLVRNLPPRTQVGLRNQVPVEHLPMVGALMNPRDSLDPYSTRSSRINANQTVDFGRASGQVNGRRTGI